MDGIISASDLLRAFFLFGTSFVFTFVVIPFVMRIIKHDEGDSWLSIHKVASIKMPALGGLKIFLSIIISICFWIPFESLPYLQYYLSALFVILILGIKDDFEPLDPMFKFLIQFCAAAILVFLADLYIVDFKSVFGIYTESKLTSQLLSMVLIVFLINAINFIDGINGLCAAITVLMAMTFGSYFLFINANSLSYISMALAGSTFAFLYYNITPARIFMGDTGSQTIGTIIAILAINFLNIQGGDLSIGIVNSPSFLLAILIIPFLDGIRVILRRLIKFKSPFDKDTSHIHHILLGKGFTHMQATLALVITNIFFILLAYNLQFLGNIILIILQLVLAFLIYIALLLKKSKSYDIIYKEIQK